MAEHNAELTDREFWIEMRRALVIMIRAICKRWGLSLPRFDE